MVKYYKTHTDRLVGVFVAYSCEGFEWFSLFLPPFLLLLTLLQFLHWDFSDFSISFSFFVGC